MTKQKAKNVLYRLVGCKPDYLFAEQVIEIIKNFGSIIEEKEKQICKMRCCQNCKYIFCDLCSEYIDKDGKKTQHRWNCKKEMYCDVGNGKKAKYQCWELAE